MCPFVCANTNRVLIKCISRQGTPLDLSRRQHWGFREAMMTREKRLPKGGGGVTRTRGGAFEVQRGVDVSSGVCKGQAGSNQMYLTPEDVSRPL